MEIRLFGKSLFKATKGDALLQMATSQTQTSKFLPDFYTLNDGWNSSAIALWTNDNVSVKKISEGNESPEKKDKLTPKGVYDLKMLNDKNFKLNTSPEYVDKQLADFKEKLSLIKSEEYDMRRGVNEISSVVVRLENRKKYETVKNIFEEYPYTTTTKINEVVKAHDYLKLGQVAQFVADMPNEAIKAMKTYDDGVNKLCGKKAVFYIIADKKDFEKTNTRRDPILLAQSPFGHFWQVVGAWDKEMLFLEEL
jgi:hypothetical protein